MTTLPDAPAMQAKTLSVGVRELARSLAFYRDVLGLTVQFSNDELAFIDAGGVALFLLTAPDLGDPPNPRWMEVVFHVEHVRAAYDALRARGVEFRIEPRVVTGNQLAADFRDPDGHVLSVFGPE